MFQHYVLSSYALTCAHLRPLRLLEEMQALGPSLLSTPNSPIYISSGSS